MSHVFTTLLFVILAAGPAFAQSTAEPISGAKHLATYAPAPVVPADARAKHLAGAGTCVVYVRSDGTVSRAEMLKSTGHRILDKVSIEAFSKWRFAPGSVKKVKI